MKPAAATWLIALIEVSTFIWAVFFGLTCVGAIMQINLSGAGAALVMAAGVTGTLSVLGPVAGWLLRHVLVVRLERGRRGFAVLPPR